MKRIFVKSKKKRNIPLYSLTYEAQWFTMYKRPVLDEKTKEKIEVEAPKIAKRAGAKLVRMQVKDNCVNILFEADPDTAPHTVVKAVKNTLAGNLRADGTPLASRLPCLWAPGYILCTTGGYLSEEEINHFKTSLQNSRLSKKKGQHNAN